MPQEQAAVFPKHIFASIAGHPKQIVVSPILIESAAMDAARIFERFVTRSKGLTTEEVKTRLAEHGPNVLAKDQRPSLAKILWRAVLNPLVVLLAVLASVSFITGDVRAGGMMCLMIILGVGLKLIQEAKADSAASKLKAMISVIMLVGISLPFSPIGRYLGFTPLPLLYWPLLTLTLLCYLVLTQSIKMWLLRKNWI